MDEEIIYMLNRFPRHRIEILNAIDHNEEFKILCHDFYTSAKVLEKYQHNMIKNLKGEMEYQCLFDDLEKEIVEYLYSSDKK